MIVSNQNWCPGQVWKVKAKLSVHTISVNTIRWCEWFPCKDKTRKCIKPWATIEVFYLLIFYSSRKGQVKTFSVGDDEVCSLSLSHLRWLVFYLWSQVRSCTLVLCLALRQVLSEQMGMTESTQAVATQPAQVCWTSSCLLCLQLHSVVLQCC